jgi:hypothetical protein
MEVTMNATTARPHAVSAPGTLRACSVGSILFIALIVGGVQWNHARSHTHEQVEPEDTAYEVEYLPSQFGFRAIDFDDPANCYDGRGSSC